MAVWFITGASRGFGRSWAQAALERGDSVAATARDVATLDGLVEQFGDRVLPIRLDVTDRAADFAAVASAHERFGRLDIVVNNAGYGHYGFVEELTEDDVRPQFETNVFGVLWVTQAALPFMRQQGSGHILQVSSLGGLIATPILGAYNASKWALEAFSQALAQEVASFGINVTIIEPGPFGTDFNGASAAISPELADYDEIRTNVSERRRAQVAAQTSSPAATVNAILAVVDSEDPPLRLFLGASPLEWVRLEYESRLETWDRWQDIAATASDARP